MNQERRESILAILNTKPFITVRELEKNFPDVSSMTLRRDIKFFEQQGEVVRVRGGFKSMKFITTSVDGKFSSRAATNTLEKEKITKAALRFVETGRSLFVDSGTTMMRFASLIPNARLSITTTGPNVALELANKTEIIINLVGGMLNRENISLSGNHAIDFVNSINIDVAFIVPSGASVENGFTSGNYIECELKKLVVEKARKVVLLFDHSKIDHSMPYTFCGLKEADVLITDAELPTEFAEEAKKNNVEVICV